MYNNRGIAENKEDKKNSEVFYRISMKNPCTETITCDFIEVSKLRPGLVSIHFCPDSGISFCFFFKFSATSLFFLSFFNSFVLQILFVKRTHQEKGRKIAGDCANQSILPNRFLGGRQQFCP